MLSYVVSNRPCTNDLAALLHLFYDLCSSPIPNREMALMGLTDEIITRPPFHLARSLFSSREKVELGEGGQSPLCGEASQATAH